MTDIELIEKVLKSKKPSDIFLDDWKKEYVRFSKLIHPDACTHPKASDAMAIINHYKDVIENGIGFVDEAGTFRVFEKKIEYDVNDTNLKLITKSLENYKKLMSLRDKSSVHFQKYLPKEMRIENNKLIITLNERAVPLTQQQLPQIHVNWIFSRMFEFVLWLKQVGYTHMGLNPTTVFVIPETHGICVVSFYHMTKLGTKAKTVSAKYKMWYPTNLYMHKIATPDIDLELSKKIALYLLGDKSAAGTKLKMNKKDINQNVLTFLLTKHQNRFSEYEEYREILKKEFKKEFFILDL